MTLSGVSTPGEIIPGSNSDEGYSTFRKIPRINVISRTHVVKFLPLFKNTVSVFYKSRRLGLRDKKMTMSSSMEKGKLKKYTKNKPQTTLSLFQPPSNMR